MVHRSCAAAAKSVRGGADTRMRRGAVGLRVLPAHAVLGLRVLRHRQPGGAPGCGLLSRAVYELLPCNVERPQWNRWLWSAASPARVRARAAAVLQYACRVRGLPGVHHQIRPCTDGRGLHHPGSAAVLRRGPPPGCFTWSTSDACNNDGGTTQGAVCF